jgi:site-specific recombinase XerD
MGPGFESQRDHKIRIATDSKTTKKRLKMYFEPLFCCFYVIFNFIIFVCYRLLSVFVSLFISLNVSLMDKLISIDFELGSFVRTNGTSFIFIRVTQNRKIKRITTGVAVHRDYWNKDKKEIRRNHPDSVALNLNINDQKNKVQSMYSEMVDKKMAVSIEYLTNKKGHVPVQEKPVSILAYYALFVKSHNENIGTGTAKAWLSRLEKLKKYVEYCLKTKDVPLEEITANWTTKLYKWYLSEKTGKSHAHRAVSSLRQVLAAAENDGLIQKNVITGMKFEKSKPKPIVFLTIAEITLLDQCPFYDDRLRRVLDSFIFQCFTGMAYSELVNFDAKKHLIVDANKVSWILMSRGKTDVDCRIPLLPQAAAVLAKYQNKPPVITNQKMNGFLKEIAKIAGLTDPDRLTTHVGRKTAGTYLLNKGVPMLVVSKILGHKSVRTTEAYYAYLQNDSIYDAVKGLY